MDRCVTLSILIGLHFFPAFPLRQVEAVYVAYDLPLPRCWND
jgi:hypothetical protein